MFLILTVVSAVFFLMDTCSDEYLLVEWQSGEALHGDAIYYLTGGIPADAVCGTVLRYLCGCRPVRTGLWGKCRLYADSAHGGKMVCGASDDAGQHCFLAGGAV